MGTNKYFDPYSDKGEQRLYRELINEIVQNWGITCQYIPRGSQSNVDMIFGDDPTKKFTEAYPIEMYIQNTDTFDGGDLFTKFGLTISKQVKLLIASDAFNKATAGTLGVRPREGDLVWLDNFKILFEIKFVNQDKFFYAFGNRQFYGYELVCEEFRYNNEKIESGVLEIDDKVNEVKVAYLAVMGTGNNTYVVEETVYQGASLGAATATAAVLSWDIVAKNLVLKDLVGKFLVNNSIIGVTSNASYNMLSIETENNVNETLDNNIELRADANTFLDLTETNASGNPITSQSQE